MYAIDYLSGKTTTPSPPTLTEITPAAARKMLEDSASFQNRPIKKANVREYADSIRAGEWNHHVGDPIRLDTHGRVLDGQHRLLAVIESGTPQHFYVISNLPPDAVNYMDIGRPRSHSDFIGMTEDGDKYPTQIAAGIRWITRYELETLSSQRNVIPKHKVAEYLRNNPGIVKSAAVAERVRDVLRRCGVATGAHYLFSRIDEEQADAFFEKLRTGLGMTENDPIYRLRERLIDPWRKLNEWECSAILIKAWNYTRRGVQVQRLIWTPGKEDFPKAI